MNTEAFKKRIMLDNFNVTGETCTFMICTDCNSKCKHCFISHKFNENKIISKEIIDKTFEIINENFVINILGGEPMLYPEICKYICDKARTVGAITSIVTNSFWIENKNLVLFLENEIKPDLLILSTDKWHREFISLEKISKIINYFENKIQIALQLVIDNENYSSIKEEKLVLDTIDIKNKNVFFIINPLRKFGRAKDNNIGMETSLCEKGICSVNGFIIDYNGNCSVKCENILTPKKECEIWSKNIIKENFEFEKFKLFVKSKQIYFRDDLKNEDNFKYKEIFNGY